MKIKISKLNPNPFKKEINKGKLSDEQVKKLMSNLDKLKLMGALPVVKRESKFYLVAGHHRVEALKRKFGENYEIEVTIHNYNDDELFRGMIIENLSQRRGEFQETKSNIVACRNHLKNFPEILKELRGDSPRGSSKHTTLPDEVTANDISEWIDKQTEKVLSKDEILDFLNINDKLDEDLQKVIELKHDKTKEERDNPDTINKSQAVILARIDDKKEQKDLAEALKNSQEQRVREQGKLVSAYKDATEEVKEKVRGGELDIADIPIENLKDNLKKRIEEDKEKNKGKIVVAHFKQYQREAGNKVGSTNQKIMQTCAFLDGMDKTGVLFELDWKDMYNILEMATTGGKKYAGFADKILKKL